jgi:hypothetical protein
MLNEAENNDYFNTEANLVHIISMKWFKNWSKFHKQNEIIDPKNPKLNHGIKRKKSTVLDEDELTHPGPLIAEDLLDEEFSFLKDPSPIKNYCNYKINQALTEGVDFKIISHKLWLFFYQTYGGVNIKRYVTSINDDRDET